MKYNLPQTKQRCPELDIFSLGFLWGNGRYSGDKFIVQYIDKNVLSQIRDQVSPSQKVFPLKEPGKKLAYRLQLHFYNPYVFWLREHGYEGKKGNEQRTIPVFASSEEEAEFLRGFFLPHHTIDQQFRKWGTVFRIRFYTAAPILERLNQHLHRVLDTGLKKIQPHGQNKVCHILYYQSKEEVQKIIEYLRLTNK
ncbi:hypothetical protein JK635_07635 [Neobacillus sp. YIM B02564]|uniref:DOD-type homing endonuclease domain-containing protein n=1 Tax=Neobacillus paridis TaxID=2803862 RepID=A0ABS1TQC3_9BACI|nr:hypothetical protein [Neobacillus paridis]MBL4952080.1 hypothetical protein [Neobacillus paridis]